MEELKNEIDIREELLSLDEPPAPITWLLGGDDEKMERIAEHRLQLASIRKQYPHPVHPYKIGVYIQPLLPVQGSGLTEPDKVINLL